MKNNIIILLFFKYFFIWSMMLHYSISKLLGDYYLHRPNLHNHPSNFKLNATFQEIKTAKNKGQVELG